MKKKEGTELSYNDHLIEQVIDYLWEEEKKHYEESDKPEDHIFSVLKELKETINEH